MSKALAERTLPSSQQVQMVNGDLTEESTEAIVNAANARLIHAGGVAGAIVSQGGGIIQEESNAWVRAHGPVLHESPAWTSAGNLPAKYIIHAVGPIWGEGDEDKKLSAAVYGSLRTADELKVASLSMPAIATGIFSFPKERAADIILAALKGYFARRKSGIKLVRVVLFDAETVQAFMRAWKRWE